VPFDYTYLLYGLIGLGSVLLVEGVYFLVVDLRGRRRDPNRRLRMLAAGATRQAVLVSLRRERTFSNANGLLGRFEDLVIQSGLNAKPGRVGLMMVAFGAVGFVAAVVLGQSLVVALGAAAGLGLIVPVLGFLYVCGVAG